MTAQDAPCKQHGGKPGDTEQQRHRTQQREKASGILHFTVQRHAIDHIAQSHAK